VGLDANTAKHSDYSILKLVKRIVEMVDGCGVEIELLLQIGERFLERFLLLVDDVILQRSDEVL
jgi:hypothetical protein